MEQVIIGVDPHKLSATVEVVDHHEQLLGSGRFTTNQAGYAAMRFRRKFLSDPHAAGSLAEARKSLPAP